MDGASGAFVDILGINWSGVSVVKTRAIVAAAVTAVVVVATLTFAGGPASATVTLNEAAPFTLNVPGDVVAAAVPSVSQAGLLAIGQQYDYAFSDPAYAAVSGAFTPTPISPSTALSPSEAATFESLTADFAAPATQAAQATKLVSGEALPLLAFSVGTLIGAGASRLTGFKDDQVCAERNIGLTVLSSVLDGVDCSSWNNSLTTLQQNLDAHKPMFPDTCIIGIGCWSFTGQTAIGIYGAVENCFTGPAVPVYVTYATDGGITPADLNSTTTFFPANSDCPYRPSNEFGSDSTIPVTAFEFGSRYPAGASTISVVADSGANPSRTWICTITTVDRQTFTASSDPWSETATTLAPIVCPSLPAGETAANVTIVEHGGGVDQTVLGIGTTPSYKTWRANFPECDNGTCPLILNNNGTSCFTTGTTCDNWINDPTRATDYTCTYGTHPIALSECFIYGTTFNPANRANGHAYADPTTGEPLDTQTSPSDVDVVTSALLSREGDWVATGSYPIVDPSNMPTLARQIAAACVAQVDHENDITIIKVSPKEVCAKIPIYSPGIDVQQAAQHDATAISQSQPFLLHFENEAQKSTGTASVAPVLRGWYGDPATNCSGPVVARPDVNATNCDEYPYYSTVEGGPATATSPIGASLQNINATENGIQGNQLQQLYAACGIVSSATASEANQYIVAPNPASPSVAICGE